MEYLSTVDELVINNELIEKLLEKLAEINEKALFLFLCPNSKKSRN